MSPERLDAERDAAEDAREWADHLAGRCPPDCGWCEAGRKVAVECIVHDALTALCNTVGVTLSDDVLNELIKTVTDALDASENTML